MFEEIFKTITEKITGAARVQEENVELKKQLTEQQWHHTRQNKRLNSQLVAARRRIAALEQDLITAKRQNLDTWR